MKRKYYLLFFALLIVFSESKAQSDPFVGTFVNYSNTISLRIKPMENEYHGLLQTNQANFAMKGTVSESKMTGTIYAVNGPVDFTAQLQNNQIVLSAFGYTDNFYLFNLNHSLDNVDLTQYMNNSTNQPDHTVDNSSEDFDYSYSQHDRGYASEEYKTYPNANPKSSPYPALNDPELKRLIAGSQVVYYTRTSYVNDNVASSITYVNFCANGKFKINYDGSFSVEGSYGGNAQGATYGQNSGNWQLVNYQNKPAVFLAFNNGNTSINPIDKARVQQGRWRIGNTQYAIQRNKVNCQ